MPVLESALPPFERFKEGMRPCETHNSLLDIDFSVHVAEGRTTLVLDSESTIVPFDGWDVDPKIISKLLDARSQGIERVVIATNKRPKKEDDFWQIQWWAEQIGADLVIVPKTRQERKPSPYMLLEVAEHYGISTKSMLMVGDKLTGDVRAANNADVYSIWVGRHGEADHPGDRFLRRPYEFLLGEFVLGRKNKMNPPHAEKIEEEPLRHLLETLPEKVSVKKEGEPHIPTYVAEKGLIAGYGAGPDITLSKEKLALLREPAYAALTEPARRVFRALHTPQFEAFMKRHGGEVADAATYARLALSVATLSLLLSRKRKAAFWVYAFAQATDLIDGWAARKSDEDQNSAHRRKMGVREANVDKVLALSAGVGLTINGDKSALLLALQQLREVHRTSQRRNPAYRELDTRATRSSKNSTTGLTVADGVSMMVGATSLSNRLQIAATAGKIYSSWSSPRVWRYRREQHEAAVAIKKRLTSQ